VQPVPPGVSKADLKKHNHEQSDAAAGHPVGHAAPPPQDDGGDGLRDGVRLQPMRDAGMNGHRASGSKQQEPCGYCLEGNEFQIHADEPPKST